MIRIDSVEGNDEAKLAIALLAVDPTIGGVLFVGPPGVAKSTLARSLADLGEDAPFVEVPLGATEDRVKGSIDVTSALRDGDVVLRRGLLGAADGGVLYLDEVNLQPDHIVDLLLDAAATGVNRVERDGLSATEPARFALVATMNPEEGALRPQLRDRFAMLVEVGPPHARGAPAGASASTARREPECRRRPQHRRRRTRTSLAGRHRRRHRGSGRRRDRCRRSLLACGRRDGASSTCARCALGEDGRWSRRREGGRAPDRTRANRERTTRLVGDGSLPRSVHDATSASGAFARGCSR